MKKELDMIIDRTSWTNAPKRLRKPFPFTGNAQKTTIDFAESLLWAGVVGVPIQMPRWWFAAQWAIIRYFGAADHAVNRLRLHPATSALDSHTKAVMSDDLGVGISIHWLARRFRYAELAHAQFVLDDLRRRRIATFRSRAKNGARKCPDFLALDQKRRIHVVECKGNQAGPEETKSQFKNGLLQKRNIKFSNESLVGQRLLAGVAIAGPNSDWQSTIRISDPPPEDDTQHEEELPVEVYSIKVDDARTLMPSINKVILIQGLLLAGAFGTAHRAFPEETQSNDRSTTEDQPMETFEFRDAMYRGQVQTLIYPVPILISDHESIAGCRIKFGVSEDLLERLRERRMDQILESDFLAIEHPHGSPSKSDLIEVEHEKRSETRLERSASIQRGTAIRAELELL